MFALDENGDARITEERSYYFGGDTITRCRRHYRFEGGTMSDFQVWLDGQPMTMLGAPDDNRPEGYAAAYHNSDGYHVDVYMHCLDEVHTFTISYLVTDAVFLHTEDDRAEFEWDLSSDDEPSDIANFEAEILLPSAVDANALQIHTSGVSDDWRYHSEDGSIYSIQLTADRVSKDQAATIYIEMPRSLVPGATRVESTDSPKDEDDTMQTILHIFYDFLPFVGIGGLVFLLILSTFLKLVEQYSTGRKKLAALRLAPQTDAFLQETIPEELPPAIVSKLYSVYFPYDPDPFTIPAYQRNNSFAVTILDLANRGVLTLQR